MLLAVIILSGCGGPTRAIPPAPLVATSTPFQPVPSIVTPTPDPAAIPFPATSTPAGPTDPAIPTNTVEIITEEPPKDSPTAKPTPSTQESITVTVPILLYHHVSETIDTQYNVHPDRFAEQMKWLYDHGYSTVTIADVASAIREGTELPARPVVLTFDDGYLDVYQNAFPILQQYGYVATFYIIANTVDTAGNLNTKKLQKLLASGWEIGCHSMTHANLTEESDWNNEVINSRAVLEEKLGTEIFTFAYPYGRVNMELKTYTLNAGYTAAVGLGSIMEHNSDTLSFLHRKEIKSWYKLDFFEEFMPWTD